MNIRVALIIACLTFFVAGCSDILVSPRWRPYVHLQNDVQNNDIAAVKQDLANGVDPNEFPNENEEDLAALCIAARNGNLPMIKLLLDHGADPNIRDGWDGTPLTSAADTNNVVVMAFLVAHGANVNDDGDGSSTALWRATVGGKLPAMRFLLSHGANPNTMENTGKMERVSSVAKFFNQTAAVKLLKQYGAKE